MGNTYGQAIIVPKTNKSGGSVALGDVVVIDSTNDNAFTTDTSGAFTGRVGIAQETIANNATGRILLEGHATLVNVNASVTRGHYGKTYTVAKQATDAGTSRVAGTFCQFTTGGTTPEADVYAPDQGGASLTDPTTTEGDVIARGASGLVRVALAALGKVLIGNGTDAIADYPPGHEFDYAQITSGVSITATTEATANTVITGSAVAYDGSTRVKVEFYAPSAEADHTALRDLIICLYDGSSSIGFLAVIENTVTATDPVAEPVKAERFLTPSNATHTYSVRAYVTAGTGAVDAGAGGAGVRMPAFMRITKA